MASSRQSTCHDSPFQLVHELSEHVFQHVMNSSNCSPLDLINTIQAPTKQVPRNERDNSKTIKELTHLCLDIILLRRWEWHGISDRVMDVDMTPASRCLTFSYNLQCQGKHKEADQLANAVKSLSVKNTPFVEPDSIMTFLSLLATVQVDTLKVPLVHRSREREHFRYKSYPSSVFEKLPQSSCFDNLNEAFSQSIKLFECTPGTGFNSFFSLHPGIEGKTNTLYDGLVHSTVEDLNTRLGMPGLPSKQDDITLLAHGMESIPSLCDLPQKSHTPSSVGDEESSWMTMSLESRLVLFSAINSDVPDVIREWEGWRVSERQYLCDDSDTCFPHAAQLSLCRLCSLAGVEPSQVDQNNRFSTRQIISDVDSLPAALPQALEESGSVFCTFAETVLSLLDYFRAQLHQLSEGSSDLHLSITAHWIQPTVKFLMNIWNEMGTFPKSFSLLDALYAQAHQLQGTQYYLLMLHLLAESITPYFWFVEQWIFRGWLDLGEEFGLHTSEENLAKRDENFWNNGYTLTSDGCTPSFLSTHAHTILTCGKALNLLRICKPNHPLCTGMFLPPKLHVVLSVAGLEHCSAMCQQYRDDVSENEHIREELLKEELLAKEKELQSVVIKARQEARAHAEKLKKLEESYMTQAKEKKVAFRKELLEQIKTNQALRSEQEAEERLQDKERMDYLSLKEAALSDAHSALQQKAKEEMIAHYAELSRVAEMRKLRAEWRVKRFELSSKRLELLKNQREKYSGERARLAKATPTLVPPVRFAVEMENTVPEKDESVSLDASQTSVSSKSLPSSPKKPGRTWVESSSQRGEDIKENPPRKTWVASMAEQSLEGAPTITENIPSYPPSVAQDLIYNRQTTDPDALSRLEQITHAYPCADSSRGREQSSVAQDLLYPRDNTPPALVQEEGVPRLVSSRGQEAPSIAQDLIYGEEKMDKHVHIRRFEPQSRAQDIIYSTDWAQPGQTGPLIQEPDHPKLVSTRGHAPESTVQLKMYPLRYTEQTQVEGKQAKNSEDVGKIEAPKFEYSPSFRYRDDFSFLDDAPSHDMLAAVLGPIKEQIDTGDIDSEFLSVYPVSTLMEQSLALPIITQSTLVNEALLRYFLSECNIHHHFTVIKWFLLLEDGEFGHFLSTKLCEELTNGRNWKLLCSPSFINPILTAALEVSVHSQCPEAQRISFALKYRPVSVNTHAIDALEFLQLKYKVDWPCNIVITNASMDKYNKILQLLLQMKRASWALKNTFHQLKECKDLNPLQTRQLQVYRHEYQHFVNVMHGYIANQLFQITWREFEADLKHEVHSLEELIQAHHNFISKAIFRCLLSKKAMPVMKLIHNIFSSILRFSSQMTIEPANGQRSYSAMCETHRRFREISGLLIKVVNKLVQRGYQPHLEDFLLRLNFNDFYKQ